MITRHQQILVRRFTMHETTATNTRQIFVFLFPPAKNTSPSAMLKHPHRRTRK